MNLCGFWSMHIVAFLICSFDYSVLVPDFGVWLFVL